MNDDTFIYIPEYDSEIMLAYRIFLLTRDNNENQDYLIDRCYDEANSGDALYQCVLGYLYYFRVVTSDKGNDMEAERMFKLAASNGCAEASYALAMTRFDEDCLFEDEDEGFEMLEQVAKDGYIKAINVLGLKMYKSDDENLKRKSIKYFRLAAERGYIQAKINLILLNDDSEDVEESKYAFTLAKELALTGVAQAQYLLGKMYDDGNAAVEQDSKKAFKWFKQAADSDYPEALIELGLCYSFGTGTPVNSELAINNFLNATKHGLTIGYIYSGDLAHEGREDFEPDQNLAIKYYETACNEGDEVGALKLGRMYYYGDGVEVNNEEAFGYFFAGTKAGNIACATLLGECYAYGFGCEEDIETAMDLLKTNADEYDDGQACAILARLYADGERVKKNTKLAREYIAKGESLGTNCDNAREALGEVINNEPDEEEPEDEQPVIHHEVAIEENESVDDGQDLFDQACDLYDNDKEKEALKLFDQAAKLGNIDAIGILSHIYWGLIGYTQTNYTKAFEYASVGAKQDNPSCQLVFGLAKYYGKGTNQSIKIGLDNIKKAVKAEVPIAYYELGVIYHNGEHVTQDDSQAIDLLRNAIELDDTDVKSYKLLGEIYGDNSGITATDEINQYTLEYNTKAVELDPEYGLGYTYIGQVHLDKFEDDEAFECFTKGAELDDGDACYWLSFCYKYGRGCTKDRHLMKFYSQQAKSLRGY